MSKIFIGQGHGFADKKIHTFRVYKLFLLVMFIYIFKKNLDDTDCLVLLILKMINQSFQ